MVVWPGTGAFGLMVVWPVMMESMLVSGIEMAGASLVVGRASGVSHLLVVEPLF